MTSSRDTSSRLRQTLNPLLTTSLGGLHGPLHAYTPHSAVSTTSNYPYSAIHTPASSIQPYNPQEWAPSPLVGPERTHTFSAASSRQDSQGATPLPPPPYSPPRSQRPASGAYETSPANISAARMPAPNVHRPSPEPQSSQNFPPPPNASGRGGSRERRFGLPSLTRRRDRESADSVTPPDPHPPVSISRPQPLTVQVPRALERCETEPIPPSSRRAASAGAVETPTSARSRSASQTRWEPGMPLPPPPPCPPPSQSRSQSLTRTSDPITSPPTKRPPPQGVIALGPVPPTPANWIEEEQRRRANASVTPGLTIDTSSASSSSAAPHTEGDSASGSSSAGSALNRAGAVRGEKTLRERRTESRTRHSRGESGSDVQPLTDIAVPQGPNLSRRLSVRRGTPRSGGRINIDSVDDNAESRHSTPRPSAGLHPETPTPPFSPHPQKAYQATESGQPMAPKALPTPPPQSRSASSSSQTRPVMQSSTGSLMSAPLSSSNPTTSMHHICASSGVSLLPGRFKQPATQTGTH